MTIKTVVRMGTERLSKPSLPVEEFGTPALYELLQDMHETMLLKKGVGIAAPQIGCYLRVILFGFEKNERYPNEKPVPFTILINPEIELLSTELVSAWEGCLSVPGLRGLVPRCSELKYSGFDVEGKEITGIAHGFHARVIQHECDHINGILYPQRINDLKDFGFEEEIFARINQ
jgi:peptide deformylase